MINKHGGGAVTNKNGLQFEQDTSLKTALINSGYEVNENNKVVVNGRTVGFIASQYKFYSAFLEKRGVEWRKLVSKQLRPDEAFINEDNKTVYIIEKKFQSQSGSVDEKLQTCGFKKKQYTKLVKQIGYTIEYIYVCNDWFKQKQYDDVVNYIKECGCYIFFNEIPLDFLELN